MNNDLQLVTRADDGSTHSANLAGVFAVEKGITRNISMMALCPHFDEAAKLFAGCKGAALGLHVTLNSEWDQIRYSPVLPAAKVPNLVDERGHFLKSPDENGRRGLDLDQAMAEIKAQLDRARSLHLNLEYLDEHMGVGKIGGLRAALADFGKKEGLMIVADVPFLGIWNPKGDVAAYWADVIGKAEAGTYVLLSHPCYDDEESRRMKPEISFERDAERQALADPRVPEACRKRGARIIRYTEIKPR